MAPNAKAREDALDKSLKPRNPNLYSFNSYMKCYYFYHQCKEHFEVARSLDYKRIPFAAGFQKNRILN